MKKLAILIIFFAFFSCEKEPLGKMYEGEDYCVECIRYDVQHDPYHAYFCGTLDEVENFIVKLDTANGDWECFIKE